MYVKGGGGINIFFAIKRADNGWLIVSLSRRAADADDEGKADFNEKSKFLVLFARHGHP